MANKANMPPNFTQKWLICLGILLVLTLEKHCFRISRRCKSNKRGSLNHKLVVEMTFSLSFSVFFRIFVQFCLLVCHFCHFCLVFLVTEDPQSTTASPNSPTAVPTISPNFPKVLFGKILPREISASGNFRLGKSPLREILVTLTLDPLGPNLKKHDSFNFQIRV